MDYETRGENPRKYFGVLRYVIYTIIEHYICIDYLYFQSKKVSEITVDYKHGEKHSIGILGIGIPDLLMNLMSCHDFLKDKILLSY